jgi:thioredoxin-like negative regulator of GroEL
MAAISPTTAFSEPREPEFGDEIKEWETRLELARVLGYQKKYPEAVRQYYLVLEQQPNRQDLQLELAEIMAYDKRTEESLKILNRLAPKVSNDQDRLKIANIYATLNQFRPAQTLYLSYLDKFPNDLTARYRYAELLTWEKKYADAATQYEALIKQRPKDIQLRRKYALVLIWMGDTDKGKEELEKTLITDNQ